MAMDRPFAAENSSVRVRSFAIVVVTVVGMWSGDNVLNAIRGCHAAHFFQQRPRIGAVIYFGENVAVNIDHANFLKS